MYSWIPVIAIFSFIIVSPISLTDIGFTKILLDKTNWIVIVVLSIASVYVLVIIYQSVMASISHNFRDKVKEKITKQLTGDEHYKDVLLNVLLPCTKKEKIWWFLVSITAGFCEEIIFRSCIIFLLQSIFPVLTFFTAGLITCIFVSMFIHFIVDFSNTFVLFESDRKTDSTTVIKWKAMRMMLNVPSNTNALNSTNVQSGTNVPSCLLLYKKEMFRYEW